MRAAVDLFESRLSPGSGHEIYITEQTTPLFRQLRKRHQRLVGSEYLLPSVPRGQCTAEGVRCEDLTALTFPRESFDYVLSFEVLEHIPDYQSALREIASVLKPGGKLLCSVPFHGEERHTVRAHVAEDGSIVHRLPPEYHGDPVNPNGVLCYRYFGLELLDDLRSVGFSDASAWLYWSSSLGYLGEDRVFFVARR
jgi:SAM-dependent methyltransferase